MELITSPIFEKKLDKLIVWAARGSTAKSFYYWGVVRVNRPTISKINGCSIYELDNNIGVVIYINNQCLNVNSNRFTGFGGLKETEWNILSVYRGASFDVKVNPVILNGSTGSIKIPKITDLFDLSVALSDASQPMDIGDMIDKHVVFELSEGTINIERPINCVLSPDNIDVSLPVVNVNDLDRGEIGEKAFNLSVTCTGITNANVYLKAVNGTLNSGNILNIIDNIQESARGVGIVVDINGERVNFANNIKYKVLSNEKTGVIHFSAKYKKTGKVEAGSVNSQIIVTIDYS
ncbi:fimbrial protein [Escherichia coli]|uniref:fimbrial protein n=1 Tax=Escherichia coli TaxID=562 RepID=UPI0039E03A16